MDKEDYFLCPHCGEELPLKAKSCKYCGSDSSTGWHPDANPFASEPLPEFYYEESVQQEFGKRQEKQSINWVSITGFGVLIILLFYFLKAIST